LECAVAESAAGVGSVIKSVADPIPLERIYASANGGMVPMSRGVA
jgi:hypothetical protein